MCYYEKNYIYRVRKIANKLLLMNTKECFEINEITKDIFDFLEGKRKEEEILEYLKENYNDVNVEEIEIFLSELIEKGIIEICQE